MADRAASAPHGAIDVRISAAELLRHGGGNAAFAWAAEQAARLAAEDGRSVETSIQAIGTRRDPADDSVTLTFPLQPLAHSRPSRANHGPAMAALMARRARS